MFDFFKRKAKKDGSSDSLPRDARKRVDARMKEMDKIFNTPRPPSLKLSDGQPCEIPDHIQETIKEKFFPLASGQRVSVEQLFIKYTYLNGFGDAIIGREYTLADLPKNIERIFKCQSQALYVVEPPPGPLSRFTIYAHLRSGPIVEKDNDFSDLVVVWFSDHLPPDLKAFIAASTSNVNWKMHAVDSGY